MIKSPYVQTNSRIINSLDRVSLARLYLSLVLVLKQKIKDNSDLLEKNRVLIESNKELLERFSDMKQQSLDLLSQYGKELEKLSSIDWTGEPGKTPTESELKSIIEPLIPKVENGKDYVLTYTDMKKISSMVEVPVVEKVIEKTTEVVKESLDEDVFIEKIIKYIKDKQPIDISNIRNWQSLRPKPFDMSDQRWHGGGPTLVAGSGITLTSNSNGTTTVAASSSGVNIANEKLTPTQSGSNITLDLTGLSHTFSTILGVYKNGQLLDQTDTSFGWSRSSNTITVLNGFTSDIFYVTYTYA